MKYTQINNIYAHAQSSLTVNNTYLKEIRSILNMNAVDQLIFKWITLINFVS